MNGPVCVSVINMKGGVGKTTIAALLAGYASADLGLEVLAVDLDPQANLSQALMRDYQEFLDEKRPFDCRTICRLLAAPSQQVLAFIVEPG